MGFFPLAEKNAVAVGVTQEILNVINEEGMDM